MDALQRQRLRRDGDRPGRPRPVRTMNTAYLYVAVTVLCTVYGQIIVKWQTGRVGAFPTTTDDRFRYFWDLLTNPWMLSSLAATAIAAAAWIVALSHLELSRA